MGCRHGLHSLRRSRRLRLCHLRGVPSSLPSSLATAACTWPDVACDAATFAIIALDLSTLSLSSDLNLITFTPLLFLHNLSLADNFFTGRLIPALGSLFNLQHFDLSRNRFSGKIPPTSPTVSSLPG